jgi:hypothetical protein
MALPTMGKTHGVCSILRLLLKLKVINNREILACPEYMHGITYYHERKNEDISTQQAAARSVG